MNLSEAMSMLNDRQREAVEHLEGPLLVVAGPGTGKTQLLSLRAANILATRDVQPQNILCLTYTDAGVEAMRHRLVGLVGRDAYGIEVSTFHSFQDGGGRVCPRAPCVCVAGRVGQRSEAEKRSGAEQDAAREVSGMRAAW